MTAEGSGPPPRDERFPKALRLLRRHEFLQVQGSGQKIPSDCLLALVKRNGRAHSRLGLTISSKVGNAVVRVRLRRLLRECFRKRRAQWPQGLDVVLVVRASANEAAFTEVSRAFDGVTRKLQRLFPAASGGGSS
ncbi:ribonuclease P protein component [Stigmatella aurantiaca]|uniref:Ribonuclease P protein component n=1 Tax=Stigmatella aurantiaca (strain DW4/3-1) TaxID=378806 RepID=E3FZF9_STIAD|nr:ribonuclease P protein component [Stigmatella aurantiaca]ADO76160.1 ribonuclease P protein component [Stigmatella aurantiaca DW4/3-1]